MTNRTKASFERYQKAKELMSQGKTLDEAMKEAKLGSNTFYKFRNQEGEPRVKRAYNKKKKTKHLFVDLKTEPASLPHGNQSVAIIVCQPDQITQVLQNLRSYRCLKIIAREVWWNQNGV